MSKAYSTAVMYIQAGYRNDEAVEITVQNHRLDEFQEEDLAKRINRHFGN